MVYHRDGGVQWAAFVFTCQNQNSAAAYQHELEMRQKKGLINKNTLILAVEDPKANVGSGGATLNALLIVAEHLGARQGYTVVNPAVLSDKWILIMHMGQQFPFDTCGRAFVTLPMTYHADHDAEMLVCNIDLLLYQMTHKVAVNSPPGVWVCSTDMFLEIPTTINGSVFHKEDVCVLTIPSSVKYASYHGVCKISEQGYCQDIVFRKSDETLRTLTMPDDQVCLVTGVMYFSVQMASQLLSFHTMPPLDACTYIGLDNGAAPLKLSIFFDFLLAMCEEVTEEAFVTGHRSGFYGTTEKAKGLGAANMQSARKLLWRALRGTKVKACLVPNGRHSYMSTDTSMHHQHLLHNQMLLSNDAPFAWQRSSFSYSQEEDLADDCVVINSFVEDGVEVKSGCVIIHSHLTRNIHLGRNNIISGILPNDCTNGNYELEADMFLQSCTIQLPNKDGWTTHRVLVMLGTHDFVTKTMVDGGTFCNTPWQEFLDTRGIKAEDIWPSDVPKSERCLQNARLFPIAHITKVVTMNDILWFQKGSAVKPNKWFLTWRLSLEEILFMVDLTQEFQMRRDIFVTVAQQHIRSTLFERGMTRLIPLYRVACMDGLHMRILETLDNVACECANPGIVARSLANIADVLGCMANGQGGMRSGPAANFSFDKAFKLLEKGCIVEGVRALATERVHWLERSFLLVRAARHYEGAARILIRRAVMSVNMFMHTEEEARPARGEWIVVECPVRADLAGGWSDTPPITYEHGGAVCNVALTINGRKPIGVKARLIAEPKLILHLIDDTGSQTSLLTLTTLEDLADYYQPHATGALLKAAVCCAGIVQYPSEVSLQDQLMKTLGGGLEMFSWSHLPHGSGLGISSILAGAVIGVLWKASGKKFTIEALNHAVLHLEQLLTTGGGWQDQVGGLLGGVKVGFSAAQLPLRIEVRAVEVGAQALRMLEERLVLVYTGTTRLARNLLQNVIRTWYARDPEIWRVEDALVKGAWDMAEAVKKGDMAAIGACLDNYWTLKKKMAPGCEPPAVTQMIASLRPAIHGVTMAGAGGGGFLYVLTKEPHAQDFVKACLSHISGSERFSVHSCAVDHDGFTLRIEPPTDN